MSRDFALCAALAIGCAMAVALSLLLGATPVAADQILTALVGGADAATQMIVWEIRLPRALAALAVGAALGASGAALQGLLRNPLADPGVLGVSACAALAATLTLSFGLAAAGALVVPLAAVAGALAATLLLSFAAARTSSIVTLILVGAGLSSFAGALMALAMNLAPNPFSLADMVSWMLGSLTNRSLDDLALAAPFLIVGAALVAMSARGLSALSLGEEAAAGIGLDLAQARLLCVVGAGLLTGASVSLAGAIGFVGLIAPHLVRPWVDHDPARTLWPSALLAAVILLSADLLVRIAPTDTELKLGVVAALIGAPLFVWIALRRGGGDG
jgi:iron complex transport system permease protein